MNTRRKLKLKKLFEQRSSKRNTKKREGVERCGTSTKNGDVRFLFGPRTNPEDVVVSEKERYGMNVCMCVVCVCVCRSRKFEDESPRLSAESLQKHA